MNLEDFKTTVEAGRKQTGRTLVIPVSRRMSADLLTPVSAFLRIRTGASFPFLLESVEGGERLARYSFLGKNPFMQLEAHAHGTRKIAYENGKVTAESVVPEGIFEAMQQTLDEYEEIADPDLPRLRGGAVGFVSYDAVRLLESIGADGQHTDVPDGVFCFYRTIFAFDHVKHQIVLISNALVDPEDEPESCLAEALARLNQMQHELADRRAGRPQPVVLDEDRIRSNFTREGFENAVEIAKRHIFEGDALQIVLSQRFELRFKGDRFNLYRALRQVNPSPYLYFIDFKEFAIVGSSPEVLVRVEGERAELLPIAGTRPRGASREQDNELEKDLLADEKELAEHAMLVDLGRNDLGRVCDFDTVNVQRYGYVERYSHVMHIVSSISGRLRDRTRPMDVLAACFPAGTVSGAPKVAAMRIIENLETDRRGTYAGAVGYVDFSGNMDTCIAIRTMFVRGDTVAIQAGAGIVADSDPAREYDETVNKALALREAIRVAAEELI